MLQFDRASRLRKQLDFKFVFSNASKIVYHDWLALYRKNVITRPRLGIIVKKAHVKLAVDRNRIRRIIRESFRHHQSQLQSADIIVMSRSARRVNDMQLLRNDIEYLWSSLITSGE